MKRLWVGVVVLFLLLAGGIALAVSLSGLHTDISRNLENAALAAQKGDWQQARELAENADKTWSRYRHFSASFTDHEPLEQMDNLFAQLKVFETIPSPADYAALCTHLAQLSDAIAESHTLTWWNLL